jgi:hypothetical protein
MSKIILVILDGLGYAKARGYLGNVEGWVASGAARAWKMLSVVPRSPAPATSPSIPGCSRRSTAC